MRECIHCSPIYPEELAAASDMLRLQPNAHATVLNLKTCQAPLRLDLIPHNAMQEGFRGRVSQDKCPTAGLSTSSSHSSTCERESHHSLAHRHWQDSDCVGASPAVVAKQARQPHRDSDTDRHSGSTTSRYKLECRHAQATHITKTQLVLAGQLHALLVIAIKLQSSCNVPGSV